MTKSLFLVYSIMVVLAACICGCKKEVEVSAAGMNLLSLTSDNVSLLGPGSVTNIPSDYNIVAKFNNTINYETITTRSVTIIHISDSTIADTLKLNYVIDGTTLYIAPGTTLLTGAKLRLTITDSVYSVNGYHFSGTVVDFTTAGVGIDTPPQSEHQLLYLQFNGSVKDLTQRDSVVIQNLNYTDDRYGFASQAASFAAITVPGSGNIVELLSYRFRPNTKPPMPENNPPVISGAMTISTWINITGFDYKSDTIPRRAILGMAAEAGYYFELTADSTGPKSLIVSTDHYEGSKYVIHADVYPGMAQALIDGWHHLVMTFDTTSNSFTKLVYIDNIVINPTSSSIKPAGPIRLDATSPVGLVTNFTVGYYCSKSNTASRYFNYITATDTFLGALDDLRVFNVALTPAEVATLYNQEVPLQ